MTKLKGKHSILVRRPVGEVFDFLITSDQEKRRKLVPELVEYERTPEGPAGLGTRSRQTAPDRSGKLVETQYEVIEYEPDRKLTVEAISRYASDDKVPASAASRASRFVGSTILDAAGDYTRVTATYEVDAEIHGWHRLLVPYWADQQAREGEESLYRFKCVLESEVGLPPSRKPFRITWRWVAWGSYFLLVASLWWVYSSRVQLRVSSDWEPALRMTLSTMIVLPIVWIVVRYGIFGQR